jgi:molecular chaperone DnaK
VTAYGVDLGTTISSIGRADEDGRVTLFSLRDGSPRLRSVVTIDDDGEIKVGDEAQRLAPLDPDSSFSFFKRSMGTSWKVLAGDRTWTAPQLSAEVLKALAEDAASASGQRPRQAVVTIPAYFGDDARRATQEAAALADLEVLALLHEPTAACLAHRPGRSGASTVLVYDLGGGTFDVSVVRFGRDGDEVLATAGDDRLGGKDWDDVLVDLIAERVFETLGADPRDDLSVLAELQERAREAKHALSRMPRTAVTLHVAGRAHRVEVTQDEFEGLSAGLYARTEELVERVLDDIGRDADVDEVLLVGGSSRMPRCRAALERVTGLAPRSGVDPDAAVAHGAAIAAGQLQAPPRSGAAGMAIARQVRDVTAHALGFVVVSDDGSRYVNEVMIGRNAPIPANETKRTRLAVPRDGTGLLDVHMLQGEAQRPLDTNPLGRWTFERVPGHRRGHVDVDVSYAYDEHGVVHVSAAVKGRALDAPVIDREDRDLRWTDEDPSSHAAPELAVALVIDISGSMSGSKLGEAKDACCGFVDTLEEAGAGECVALVAFGSSGRLMAGLGTSPGEVRRAARGLSTSGSTNLAAGLRVAWDALGATSGRRVLVVLTDGSPDNRDAALAQRTAVVRDGGEIIARGVHGANQAFLRELATGGGELLGAGELVSSFRGIAQQLAASGGRGGMGRAR